ncbi:hypothetical protein [Streptomyces sp. XY332]|uniref:hypothetical protein n=1 Tax=Streptomyces sp. XY332 TaxID=1415561 RepID=UPI0006B2156C|nr:hypothetical protein [Streptomyces sp. XY332]KOY53476.1 hypothetical protein ADK59_35545 [Streptomyces sp. XY332]
MRIIRNVLGSVGAAAALALVITATPAAAAAPAATASVVAPTAAEPSALPLYWSPTNQYFTYKSTCDDRGAWYWDNYANVYSWDCRPTSDGYRLWLQKG